MRTVNLAFVLLLVFANLALGQSQEDRIKAQEFLSAGNTLLQKGDAEQATTLFGKVIEILPSLAIGYLNRGMAYASIGKHTEALSDAETALKLADKGPNSKTYMAMAYQIKGHVYQTQRQNTLAIEAYSLSIDLEPTNPKYHNGRGISYMSLDQNQLALKDFGKAIELDPKLPHPYVNRAVIHRRLKDPVSAIRDLDVALVLNPSSSSAYSNRGANYLDLKKYDDAIRDLSKAISLEPKWEYFYNRGRAYLDQGNYQAAIEDNTEAINRNANIHKPIHNRAIAYHRLGKNELAIEDLRRALSINGESSSVHYNLAYILFRSRKYSEASNETTKLITKFAQWKAPYVLRAEAYAKLGNATKSNADRTTASKLSASWKPSEEDFFIFDLTIDIRPETKQ